MGKCGVAMGFFGWFRIGGGRFYVYSQTAGCLSVFLNPNSLVVIITERTTNRLVIGGITKKETVGEDQSTRKNKN